MKLMIALFLSISFSFAKTAVIDVPGMVCQMCVQGMKNSFESVVKDRDKDIVVDIDKDTVTVNFKQKVSEADIKEKVKEAGYNAKKITWSEAKK